MISPTYRADPPLDAGSLTVRRLYRRYLAEAGIGFTELLIISALNDGNEYDVAGLARDLQLDAPLMSSSIANLERIRFIDRLYPSGSRPSSIRLVADPTRIAASLLVVQANVDLDLGIVGEQINQLRRSLLHLARRSTKHPDR